MEDTNTNKDTQSESLMDRFRKYWIAPLAALGAFAAIIAAAFRTGPLPQNAASRSQGGATQPAAPQGPSSRSEERRVGKEC
jgi:hypothetical protein